MIIGVPKELKNNENRVALTPAGTEMLRKAGHTVLVEHNAGLGSGLSDDLYLRAGAQVVTDLSQLYDAAEMIMKVKEPLPGEYASFHAGQILYTYLHLAAAPELTRMLMEKQVVAIAYETIEGPHHSLPLLMPMSEVAGRMAIQVGARFLEEESGGKGILLGGVAGVEAAQVVIIGGGIVGMNATMMAVGAGARVTVIDRNVDRLRYFDELFHGRVTTIMSNSYNIADWVKHADLLVGAVLLPGARAPHLVTEAMVKTMEPGSVIVDVAIDQGGSIETIDHATTHSNPTYTKFGVVHYAVANMPGAVPRTSTFALTNATLPYAQLIAEHGWRDAVRRQPELARGVNVVAGQITYQAVAESLGLPYVPLEEILAAKSEG